MRQLYVKRGLWFSLFLCVWGKAITELNCCWSRSGDFRGETDRRKSRQNRKVVYDRLSTEERNGKRPRTRSPWPTAGPFGNPGMRRSPRARISLSMGYNGAKKTKNNVSHAYSRILRPCPAMEGDTRAFSNNGENSRRIPAKKRLHAWQGGCVMSIVLHYKTRPMLSPSLFRCVGLKSSVKFMRSAFGVY